jgi:hypothetical protein
LLEKTERRSTVRSHINYVFSTILWTWFKKNVGYDTINAVVGVLGCVKDEFYRRLAVDYEDMKRCQNGDITAYLHYGDGK